MERSSAALIAHYLWLLQGAVQLHQHSVKQRQTAHVPLRERKKKKSGRGAEIKNLPVIYKPTVVFYLKVDVKLKDEDGPKPDQEAASKKQTEGHRQGEAERSFPLSTCNVY